MAELQREEEAHQRTKQQLALLQTQLQQRITAIEQGSQKELYLRLKQIQEVLDIETSSDQPSQQCQEIILQITKLQQHNLNLQDAVNQLQQDKQIWFRSMQHQPVDKSKDQIEYLNAEVMNLTRLTSSYKHQISKLTKQMNKLDVMSRVDPECLQQICHIIQPPSQELKFEDLLPLVLTKLQSQVKLIQGLEKENAKIKSKLDKQNASRDLLEGQCESRLVQLQSELKEQSRVVLQVQKEYDLQIKLLKEEKDSIKQQTGKFQKGLTELQNELSFYKDVVQEKDDLVASLQQSCKKYKQELQEMILQKQQSEVREDESYERGLKDKEDELGVECRLLNDLVRTMRQEMSQLHKANNEMRIKLYDQIQ